MFQDVRIENQELEVDQLFEVRGVQYLESVLRDVEFREILQAGKTVIFQSDKAVVSERQPGTDIQFRIVTSQCCIGSLFQVLLGIFARNSE